ncbi:MAG: hypothetical protein Q4G03_00190 [Planctomycetia bacterium]|nr:hypothetical protein [Planctomycetia bacterium]
MFTHADIRVSKVASSNGYLTAKGLFLRRLFTFKSDARVGACVQRVPTRICELQAD